MRSPQFTYKYFPLLLTTIFLAIGIIGIDHHEMWRDELQAWLIARDSHSLFDLIRNMRYEGHPALWHFLLYVITRFTHNPVAMKGLHLLIGTLCVFLVAKYSPFTRLQKVLISFGYFSLYEYLIISRNYALGVLLVFLSCCLYSQRFQKPLLFLIILGLLANTSFHGWMISVSLAIAFVLDYRFGTRKRLAATRQNNQSSIQSRLIFGAMVYLTAITAAFLLVLPPQDRSRGVGGLDLHPDFEHFLRSASAIWRSYVPLPQIHERFWNTNFLVDRIGSDINYLSHIIALVIVLIGVMTAAIILFRLSKTSFVIYGLGTSLLFVFTYAKFLGSLRHHGHFYILLLVCVWIALVEIKENPNKQSRLLRNRTQKAYLGHVLFTFLLAIQFVAALWPYYSDLRLPFTMNQAASQYVAQYITDHDQDNLGRLDNNNLIIAGYPIPSTSAFSARLNMPLYYPQTESYGSFMIWKKENVQEISDKDILSHMAEVVIRQQKECILISDKKLKLNRFRNSKYQGRVRVSKLEEFTGSIVESEHFFIYKIQ